MRTSRNYWFCQIFGWTFYALTIIFFTYLFFQAIEYLILLRLLLQTLLGIIFTHILRIIIHWQKLYVPFNNKKLIKILFFLVLITVFMNLTMSLLVEYFSIYEDNKKISFYQRFIANFVFESPTLIIWLAFYYFWQYIQLNKKKELEELNLKANLKELELKNIKYHINPHFIFNALNCIRALVDENPNLARDGITKLSHILRKSLQSNKDELIEIEEELKIVQDYLDLEKIRFDHKLEVETIINKDVLHFKMPIMMLQMMVENAIKHGISKQTTIGKIKIEIINKVDLIEIFVGNTGVFKVAETNSEVGFGISSTVNRLKFLYANKAIFSINNTSENWVEAKIIIPKTNKI